MCVVRVHVSGLTTQSISIEIRMLPVTAVALDDISLKFAILVLRFLSLNDTVVSRTACSVLNSIKYSHIKYITMKVLNILKIKT